MNKILYVSSLCSEELLDYIFKTAAQKPKQAVQKFHRLLVNGFANNSANCTIETLSTIPIVSAIHKRRIWILRSKKNNGVKYNYVPNINIGPIKNIIVFVYTFLKVWFWCIFRIRQKSIVICDVLNLSISFASSLAAKMAFTKSITIVTDLPGLLVANNGGGEKKAKTTYNRMFDYMLSNFSGFILLTEQMNPEVNKRNKPYMIMEGLVDVQMETSINALATKDKNIILIYAGGLYERYGIKTLIDAFKLTKDNHARLHLYGSGDMDQHMDNYIGDDRRILFKGMVPNNEVVKDQLKATLLINPRPTHEEFTKYSFPSKNMEYMVSGTPTLTTNLPGMPEEYKKFVYLFNDESVNGMHQTLKILLGKPKEELHQFGQNAKNFVLNKKNNVVQTKRIIKFLDTV